MKRAFFSSNKSVWTRKEPTKKKKKYTAVPCHFREFKSTSCSGLYAHRLIGCCQSYLQHCQPAGAGMGTDWFSSNIFAFWLSVEWNRGAGNVQANAARWFSHRGVSVLQLTWICLRGVQRHRAGWMEGRSHQKRATWHLKLSGSVVTWFTSPRVQRNSFSPGFQMWHNRPGTP